MLGFLPAVLILYYICPKILRNFVLLIASLIFYAWGEPVYVLIMLGSILFNYIFGLFIGTARKHEHKILAVVFLFLNFVLNLAPLCFFKYTDFAIRTINSISDAGLATLGIALPIGISFYTFQTMSYTIDVYKGVVAPQKNILNFATYVALFPQLIAGPIVQYKTVEKELSGRNESLADFSYGVYRFSVGLAKKVLLANQAGAVFDTLLKTTDLSTAGAWLGALMYSFQIYFDFSGYSDMAIGLGRMFGFHFLENFDHPYISRSVTEFWRRWHISLGTWFKEYVYIPLGGNKLGIGRQIVNIMIVWALTGLWHGAGFNFIIWGLYYGILLLLEKLFMLKIWNKLPRVFGMFVTFVLAVIGWTIFAITDINELINYLKIMFFDGAMINGTAIYYWRENITLLVILVICSLDWTKAVRFLFALNDGEEENAGLVIVRCFVMVVLLVVSVTFLAAGSYNPFLYFRF